MRRSLFSLPVSGELYLRSVNAVRPSRRGCAAPQDDDSEISHPEERASSERLEGRTTQGLSDHRHLAAVALPVLDVVQRRSRQHLRLLLADLADDLAGRPHDQTVVGNLLALGNQRAGADQAVATDLRTVEHDRADADQAVVADRAAMKHHQVTNGHIGADEQGHAVISVKYRSILDVAVLADRDGIGIASSHRTPPDAGVFLQDHRTHHRSTRRDPVFAFRRQRRRQGAQSINSHIFVSYIYRDGLLNDFETTLASILSGDSRGPRPSRILRGQIPVHGLLTMENRVSRIVSRRLKAPPVSRSASEPPGRACDTYSSVSTQGRAVSATPFFLAPMEASR